jgi:Zn-dependent protease with chaperone function
VVHVVAIDVSRSGINAWKAFPADPAAYFSAEEIAKAKEYVTPLRRVGLVQRIVTYAVEVAIVGFKIGPKVLRHFHHGWVPAVAVMVVLTTVIAVITGVGFDAWRELGYDKRWGFSKQTGRQFASDQLKGLLVGIVVSLLLFEVLWAVIRNTDLWWVWGWVAVGLLSLVFGILAPVLILPLFNKYTRLDNEELHTELVDLAQGVGADLSEVQVSDASKRDTRDNAFVTGMGATRRLVIFDTMLQRPREQLRSVAAHEIGHWKLRHVVRQVPLVAGLLFINFAVLKLALSWHWLLHFAGVSSVRDPAAIPLFNLVFPLPALLTGLASSWYSRGCERQADLFALEATDDAPAASAVERALHVDNLADLAPSLWRRLNASHPPPAERLAMIDAWQTRRVAK